MPDLTRGEKMQFLFALPQYCRHSNGLEKCGIKKVVDMQSKTFIIGLLHLADDCIGYFSLKRFRKQKIKRGLLFNIYILWYVCIVSVIPRK